MTSRGRAWLRLEGVSIRSLLTCCPSLNSPPDTAAHMSDMNNIDRVPSGVTAGGEFASRDRPEGDITLGIGRSQPGDYLEQQGSAGLCWHRTDQDVNVETGFSDAEFNSITDHYLIAALWSTSTMGDDEEEFLDGNHGIDDIAESARDKTQTELAQFLTDNKELLELARATNYGLSSGDVSGFIGQVGHDFLLTRNGAGVGFWDRQELYDGGLGEALSESSRSFGTADFYIGDDGKIYL